ncbi:MAG: hypothetical protein ACP5KI_07115 [Brevinematia bacterium]
MNIGCGKIELDEFLLNVENPTEEFYKHIEECKECREEFVNIRRGVRKMELIEFEKPKKELNYGKILLQIKDGFLEIVDAISGTRYGTKLAMFQEFRGEKFISNRKEVIYETDDIKIFVGFYDANELVLSVRINDYEEIAILNERKDIIRITKGKSGVDTRIKQGKYFVRYKDKEIALEVKEG